MVKGPGGTELTLGLAAEGSGGARRAVCRTAVPGSYTVEVGGERFAFDAVRALASEDLYFHLDAARLRRMAAAAGGDYVPLADLPARLARLEGRLQQDVELRQVRLWNLWGLLLLFAALVTLDWVLRRRRGLVL